MSLWFCFWFLNLGELERNELDEISLSLADRWDELCRILGVNENLLKEYYSQKRERTYDILNLWMKAEDKPSRGNLIEKLKNMRPYPCKIIEFLFFKWRLFFLVFFSGKFRRCCSYCCCYCCCYMFDRLWCFFCWLCRESFCCSCLVFIIGIYTITCRPWNDFSRIVGQNVR